MRRTSLIDHLKYIKQIRVSLLIRLGIAHAQHCVCGLAHLSGLRVPADDRRTVEVPHQIQWSTITVVVIQIVAVNTLVHYFSPLDLVSVFLKNTFALAFASFSRRALVASRGVPTGRKFSAPYLSRSPAFSMDCRRSSLSLGVNF